MEAATQTLQRYSAYKDSGVEWLGQVPEHWEVIPGFTILKESKTKNIGLIEKTVLSLSYGNVIVKSADKLTGLVPESFETYQLVEPGDIIIRPTDLQNDKNSLRTGLAKDKGIITSAYINLRPKKNQSHLFHHYYLHTIDINKVIYGLGSGLRQNISFDDFKRFPFPVPPLVEQKAIATYLDDKTTKIDAAIAIKVQQIQLLKERKQILIHKAVTQGLDDTVKLKDSGVEWIGEIPEHWEVKDFRYMFSLSKGLTITKENLQEEGIPCVNYGEIHSKFGFEVDTKIHKLKCVDEEYSKSNPNALIKEGDFVFADTSEDIEGSGNFTYLKSEEPIFAGYHTVIAKPIYKIDSRFFAYEFESQIFRNQIRKMVKGVKVYSITQAILKRPTVWTPPLKEQTEIMLYLDDKTQKIETAIDLKQQEIAKLKEYKSSLINSVVTGKVKVSE
jgi:type I restriction enzyme S subunit